MKNALQLFRPVAIVLAIMLGATGAAKAQVSIGINMSVYPQFVRVPNYPVYYAPGLQANFFFYDGLYWVYQQDGWYSSTWYDGPWYGVAPQAVPLYVLRIPVRYYRNPPPYFRGWQSDAPPRWGDHWGNDWSRQRSGWDRWNRRAAPAPAPLPAYQRQYSGDRYPRIEQQHALQTRNYRYQQRDSMVRQQVQQAVERREPPAPAAQRRDVAPARPDTARPAQPPGLVQGRGQPQDHGNSKGHGHDKDKDHEANDEPTQQRKK